MRTITINRKKSFVGSAMKMYVYIFSQDGNVNIGGMKYKLLGTLRNNGKLEFEISENAEKLHLCYWKSENFFPLKYAIPQGTNNIQLNVKAKFNPFKGNPIVLI